MKYEIFNRFSDEVNLPVLTAGQSKCFGLGGYGSGDIKLVVSDNNSEIALPEEDTIAFIFDGVEVGKLTYAKDGVHFEGDVDTSTKVFFDTYIDLVKRYIKAHD